MDTNHIFKDHNNTYSSDTDIFHVWTEPTVFHNATHIYFNSTLFDITQGTGAPARRYAPPSCEMFRLVCYFGLIGLLCLLGLVGNTLSIFVLQKDRSNRVVTFLLQSLAVADNSVLLLSLFALSIFYGYLHNVVSGDMMGKIMAYTYKYVHPLGYMSHTATVWTTVLLALNRYVAICRPYQERKFCTLTKARIQVACVFTFAIGFNFPRFFQFDIVLNSSNKTIHVTTAISESSTFGAVYTNALYSILCVFLPITMLIIFNIKLIREVRKMMRRRASSFSNEPQNKENNITRVMMLVIVVAVVCHLPDRLLHVYQYMKDYADLGCGKLGYYIYFCTNLLIVTNSSTNFLIYYFMRKKFRRILKQKLCYCINKNYRIGSSLESGAQNGALLTMDTRLNKKTSNGNLHTVETVDS